MNIAHLLNPEESDSETESLDFCSPFTSTIEHQEHISADILSNLSRSRKYPNSGSYHQLENNTSLSKYRSIQNLLDHDNTQNLNKTHGFETDDLRPRSGQFQPISSARESKTQFLLSKDEEQQSFLVDHKQPSRDNTAINNNSVQEEKEEYPEELNGARTKYARRFSTTEQGSYENKNAYKIRREIGDDNSRLVESSSGNDNIVKSLKIQKQGRNTIDFSTTNNNEITSTKFERNGDGKFRCSWPRCGKEFAVESRLTTHYRIHSGKPLYPCDYPGCNKAFHTSSSLSHHRVIHSDQNLRPFVCRHDRCGATYTQLARLITHQRTTHHDSLTPNDINVNQNYDKGGRMDMISRREAARTMTSIREQGVMIP